MKAILGSSSSDLMMTPTFIKVVTLSLLSFSLFFLFKHFSDTHPQPLSFPTPTSTSASISTATATAVVNSSNPQLPSNPTPARPQQQVERPAVVVERTGIIDENGVMTEDFVVGEFDPSVIETVVDLSAQEETESDEKRRSRAKIEKYKFCDESMTEYIPCLDNVEAISRLNSSEGREKYERRCPKKGKELDCLVPRPKGYKLRIPWPQSRDKVWFDNMPYTHLAEDSQSWMSRKKDKFIFPGDGTPIFHGADQYLDQISKMVPDIAFGRKTRVALDIGCGVATFGAYLFERNVTTLSIAPKDVHENHIQFALERGVPAIVAAFATHRLPYPSQAFDLIHCSSCGINWTRDDGILLLEANRVLRAGGYFVWAPQPVNKHEDNLEEQWKEMEDFSRRICWELVKREGYIVIWRKPLNNSCYFSRDAGVQPPLCDAGDDPDNVWYIGLKACITRLPQNGLGANVTMWPARLHHPPDRLFSIKMDAEMSRREIYNAASKYWNDIVGGYVRVFRWKKFGLRNVMDMRAAYGGFAVALHDFQIDCWVMNVVPTSGSNTLPVIYDRGLIGVMHDWCEPFDTFPRTYDLLNAAGLFSVEQQRCNISAIMLEMDRILRPGGRAYIRDTTDVIYELQDIAKAMGWVCYLYNTGEGPHASWKLLNCEKRL